jgi:hypothetical protein
VVSISKHLSREEEEGGGGWLRVGDKVMGE